MKPTLTKEDKVAIIEALEKHKKKYKGGNPFPTIEEETFDKAIEIVESFPVSTLPESKIDNWFRVSERLPKDWEEVLFHPRSKLSFSAKHYGGMWFDGYSTHGVQYEVTHWRPFPNPPTST